MIKDLVQLATYDYILYYGKIYRRMLQGYRYVQGDELPEDYGLYSVTFALLEDYLYGGNEIFRNQLNFTETFNYNYWLKQDVIPVRLICKLQLK